MHLRESSSSAQSSVSCAFWTPKDSMRDVNTPGSDSIVHQSDILICYIDRLLVGVVDS
jgi:hypothetical protein